MHTSTHITYKSNNVMPDAMNNKLLQIMVGNVKTPVSL